MGKRLNPFYEIVHTNSYPQNFRRENAKKHFKMAAILIIKDRYYLTDNYLKDTLIKKRQIFWIYVIWITKLQPIKEYFNVGLLDKVNKANLVCKTARLIHTRFNNAKRSKLYWKELEIPTSGVLITTDSCIMRFTKCSTFLSLLEMRACFSMSETSFLNLKWFPISK